MSNVMDQTTLQYNLTEKDMSTITHALRCAAEGFRENAKVLREVEAEQTPTGQISSKYQLSQEFDRYADTAFALYQNLEGSN